MAKEQKKKDPMEFAKLGRRYLAARMRTQRGEYLLCHWKRMFWRWKRGRWRTIDKSEVEVDIMRWLMTIGVSTPAKAENICKVLPALVHRDEDVEMPSLEGMTSFKTHRLVSFPNGFATVDDLIKLGERGLQPSSPRLFTGTSYPYNYDANAKCPLWEQSLEVCLPVEEDRRLLRQWFGYMLIPTTDFETALFMIGSGKNGKSVVMSAAHEMLGPENVSDVPLEDVTKDFHMGQLENRLANLCDEAGRMSDEAVWKLKWIISGTSVAVNNKYEPVRRGVKLFARIMVAANQFPDLDDRSEGLWRRMLVLPFGHEIPEEKRIYGLKDKLKDERQGIFNWALEGLRDLEDHGQWVETNHSGEYLESLRLNRNHLDFFFKVHVVSGEGWLTRSEIREEYSKFCDHNDIEQSVRSSFHRFDSLMKTRFPNARPIMRNGVRGYDGVRFTGESVNGQVQSVPEVRG